MADFLVMFHTNWADEADFGGFTLRRAKNSQECKALVRQQILDSLDGEDSAFEVGFGTNEYNEYRNVDQHLKEFAFKQLPDGVAEVLTKVFPVLKDGGAYGNVGRLYY